MNGYSSNIVSYLARQASDQGARKALVVQDSVKKESHVTFAELWEQVDRTSAGLKLAGLQSGDRVIVMIPMSIELYVLLLAILKCGAIAVFVDPWVGRKEITAFAKFADARAWIGIPKSHLLRLIDRSLRKIRLSITTGSKLFGIGGRYSLSEIQSSPGDGSIADVSAEDTALITFTSGSSGLPKGVNRTHGFLVAQHIALQQEFPQTDHDVDMPMFPVFALNNLGRGVTSVIPDMDFRRVDRVNAESIDRQMRKHRVTTCTASPPFFDRLAEYQQSVNESRYHLRRILTGGAPVNDLQLADWVKAWPQTEILVVYGSTEAEPVAHTDSNERLVMKSTAPLSGYCVGQPSPTVTLRVIRIHKGSITLADGDWSDWELPIGEIGELVVSGPHVAQSYFQNPMAMATNKIIDSEGQVWHRMGDTGFLDEAGNVWLVGQVHSTIYRDGKEIHPQQLERIAVGHNRDTRAAAVGLPDATLGERVIVVVEQCSSNESLPQIRHRIEAAGLTIDEVRFATQPLPLDPRHRSKIDYPALRKQLLNSQPSA